jgi:hypothetical protein
MRLRLSGTTIDQGVDCLRDSEIPCQVEVVLVGGWRAGDGDDGDAKTTRGVVLGRRSGRDC